MMSCFPNFLNLANFSISFTDHDHTASTDCDHHFCLSDYICHHAAHHSSSKYNYDDKCQYKHFTSFDLYSIHHHCVYCTWNHKYLYQYLRDYTASQYSGQHEFDHHDTTGVIIYANFNHNSDGNGDRDGHGHSDRDIDPAGLRSDTFSSNLDRPRGDPVTCDLDSLCRDAISSHHDLSLVSTQIPSSTNVLTSPLQHNNSYPSGHYHTDGHTVSRYSTADDLNGLCSDTITNDFDSLRNDTFASNLDGVCSDAVSSDHDSGFVSTCNSHFE
jgi:hypothetical protein